MSALHSPRVQNNHRRLRRQLSGPDIGEHLCILRHTTLARPPMQGAAGRITFPLARRPITGEKDSIWTHEDDTQCHEAYQEEVYLTSGYSKRDYEEVQAFKRIQDR